METSRLATSAKSRRHREDIATSAESQEIASVGPIKIYNDVALRHEPTHRGHEGAPRRTFKAVAPQPRTQMLQLPAD